MISVVQDKDTISIFISGTQSRESFTELVQRATNLWPDATPEIKVFADRITNPMLLEHLSSEAGLQPYETQDTSPSAKEKARTKRIGVNCVVCKSINLLDVKEGVSEVIFKCSHCHGSNRFVRSSS